jgi:hypothetical protein
LITTGGINTAIYGIKYINLHVARKFSKEAEAIIGKNGELTIGKNPLSGYFVPIHICILKETG